jgi:mono/diheme cytochrome c family protein
VLAVTMSAKFAPIAERGTPPKQRRWDVGGDFRFLFASRLNRFAMRITIQTGKLAAVRWTTRLNGYLRPLLCGGVLALSLGWPIFARTAEPLAPAIPTAGWFTRDQASRGRTQYRTQCAACHADNMAGIGPAPPLAGSAFLAKWSSLTVFDLFERVRTTMPQNAPHSLDEAVYADIIAYILRTNNFPIGSADLPVDSERLRDMPLTRGAP